MRKKGLTVILMLFCLAWEVGAEQLMVRYDGSARPVMAAKGQWMLGGNAAYSGHENQDYTFAFANDIHSVGFKLSAAPEFCWFFKDNLGIGGKLSYGRTMLSLAEGSAEFGNVSIGIQDYYTVSQNTSFMAFIRYYIPIGYSRRLAFHVDAGLQGLYGQGKQTDEHSGAVVGTWQSRWKAALVCHPGLTAFLSDRTALFASVGIAGLSYGDRTQIHNQVAHGSASSFSVSYLLDLTSPNIGIDFMLGKK